MSLNTFFLFLQTPKDPNWANQTWQIPILDEQGNPQVLDGWSFTASSSTESSSGLTEVDESVNPSEDVGHLDQNALSSLSNTSPLRFYSFCSEWLSNISMIDSQSLNEGPNPLNSSSEPEDTVFSSKEEDNATLIEEMPIPLRVSPDMKV